MVKKIGFWIGGLVAVLVAFWIIDLPYTVRLKTAIVRMLPLEPEAINNTIQSLCAGAHSGSAIYSCYSNFYSTEAAKTVADEAKRKRKCADMSRQIAANDKEWVKFDPSTLTQSQRTQRAPSERELYYLYVGDDPGIKNKGPLLSFYPDKCELRSLTGVYTFTAD